MTRALFLAATLVSVWVLWESVPRVDVEASRAESGTAPVAAAPSRAPEPRPDRNLFVFVQPEPLLVPEVPAAVLAPPLVPLQPVVPPPPELRLLGVMREGGRPRALLTIEGETALVGAGESLRGYTVLTISEDAVRLRHPDRGETTVELPG